MSNKEVYTTTTFNFRDNQIEIKHGITLFDALIIINTVKEMSFGEDGEYQPEYTDFALRIQTIEKYTNYELPDSLEDRYFLAYGTDLYHEILSRINEDQYCEIETAITKKINYQLRTNENIYSNEIEKLMSNFEELESALGKLFSGVTSDQIVGVLNAVVDNNIDEEKLVKAYIEHGKNKAD